MNRKPKIEKTCEICNIKFYVCPCDSDRRFCKKQCFDLSKKGKIPTGPNLHANQKIKVQCAECGKEFSLKPSRVKRSKNLFCSKDCSAKHNRKELSPHIDKLTIESLYIEQQLSILQIAAQLESTVWVIRRTMNDYGVPIRDRQNRSSASWIHATSERREKASMTAKSNIKKMLLLPDSKRREIAVSGAAALQSQRGPTSIERKMMNALNIAGIEYQFQKEIGRKFLCDFALSHYPIIIECDGIYWHSRPSAIRRDKSKDAYLKKCGYTVLRFTDKQINSDMDGCINKIKILVSSQPPADNSIK